MKRFLNETDEKEAKSSVITVMVILIVLLIIIAVLAYLLKIGIIQVPERWSTLSGEIPLKIIDVYVKIKLSNNTEIVVER